MPVTSSNSVYYVDFDKLRDRFKAEREIRGVSRSVIEAETGIHGTVLIGFENHGKKLGVDTFVTLVKWIGANPSDFVQRRRGALRHIDTPEQRQLRLAMAFLDKEGVERPNGEQVVETLIRLLTEAGKSPAVTEAGTDA
jgi:hypothetical protein